ncbi:MAG: PilX N-terminal domain-containing pilus assembly protein [Permianibacter sp.]
MQMSSRFQSGAALLVSLVILLILSIIGISAMRGGLLQTLMAANTQQLYVAQNASDGAVEAMYYQVNVQRTTAGNMLSEAILGNQVSFSINETGALVAGDDVFMDGDRDRPIIQASADAVFIGCGSVGDTAGVSGMCPASSLSPTTPFRCNVFRLDGNGTVADVEAQTEMWIAALAANCS